MEKRNFDGLNTTLVHNLKRKIDELRESVEKFRAIFDGDRDGILVADGKTKRFVAVNSAMIKMLGYTEKELLQMDVSKIHPKKDLPYVIEQFTKQLKGEIDIAGNLPVLRKDKTTFYADINSVPMRIGGQDVLVGFFKDVTERKIAEGKLKESEEKYKAIVENATDQIFMLDTELRFISINTKAASMSHHTPEEMIGKSILDLFPKDTATMFAKNNKEVIETGKSKFIEEKMVVNGKEFYNNTILNPIKDSKGNVVAVMGIVRDVTERKMAEERIKESENMYRTLFESSSDAIMMIAPPTWRFTSGNPSTIKMFKARDEKDFTSIGPWDVSPKYQPDGQLSTAKAKKMIMKAMRTGKNFFEWTHKRINGEDFPATVLLTRIELGGKKMIQATVRDISELKITQEKIEAQNRFLSSIFEAVNNPFYVIDAKNYKVLKANFAAHMGKLANETTCYAMTHKRDTPCNSKTDPCPLEIVKKTKKPTVVEHVHYIDGKQRIVEVHGYPILDAKGDVIQMIEQGLDITERKKAEEKLKESEKSYKDLVENIGFPVIITDKMGKILFMNDIGAKKLGLKHENVIGKNIYQLFPKKEADGKLRIVKTVIRTKKKVVLEYPSTFKNKTVWHEAHIFPVRDTVGNTNAEIVTYDITRRKELEEKIKKIKKVSFF